MYAHRRRHGSVPAARRRSRSAGHARASALPNRFHAFRTSAALVLAGLGAFAATAMAATPRQPASAHAAQVSHAVRDLPQRPILEVRTRTLQWTKVPSASGYILEGLHHKLAATRWLVRGTRFTPRPNPGQTVTFRVRANLPRAPWAKPVSIRYPLASTRSSASTAAPLLQIRGLKISWGSQAGVTDFKAAISTAPRGSPNRTTTYEDLGHVTSWTPSATCGQTLYYGVASERSAGEQWASKEVSITWPACAHTTKLIVGVEHAVQDGSFTPGMTSSFLNAGVTWDRNGDPTAARAAGFSMIVTPNNGSDGNCNGDSVAAVVSIAMKEIPLMRTESDHMMELCNESYWTLSAQQYADDYDAVQKQLAGTGITLGAVAVWPNDWCSTCESWFRDMIAEIAADNGHEPLSIAAREVDAWVIHPYGTPVSKYDQAITSAHAAAVAAGSDAPFWITETGECIQGTSSNSPAPDDDPGGKTCPLDWVSQATQASDLTEELNDLVEPVPGDSGTPYNWVTAWIWYQAADDSSGDWGMFDETCSDVCDISTERPVFTALQRWMQQHKSQTDG